MFLHEFSKTYANHLNSLQVDNGSPPVTQKLLSPENIILLFQPADSPAVNPIERGWQAVKDQVSGLPVAPWDELRRERDVGLNSLTAEFIASLTGYDCILSALKEANLIA